MPCAKKQKTLSQHDLVCDLSYLQLQRIGMLFTVGLERGDKKRAMNRLRAESQHKSHHLSSFRTGAALGVALPAVICGIYLCMLYVLLLVIS